MGAVDVDTINIKVCQTELSAFLKKNAISLSLYEAKRVAELIGETYNNRTVYIYINGGTLLTRAVYSV